MKIAVTYKDGNVFGHFGHTEKFKIYDVENNAVINAEIVDTNGSGHGALSSFLAERNVDVLICGGIGSGAKTAIAQANIKLYGGVVGNTDEAVEKFLGGTLEYNPNVKCSHHGDGHTCSSHKCTH